MKYTNAQDISMSILEKIPKFSTCLLYSAEFELFLASLDVLFIRELWNIQF